MDKVRVKAHAKTNLVLRVLNRESSGYHNIETIFALLGLHDTIKVERSIRGVGVEVEGADTGPERQNLAYKAAEAVLDAIAWPFGVHIHLQKSIPVQAGLGGGSSDGAATLHAVNLLAGDSLPKNRILDAAAELGSDVPFFASKAAFAIGRGRGDQLTEIPGPPSAPALIVQPEFGVSTGEAYESLAASRTDAKSPQPLEVPDYGFTDWPDIAELSRNDFEAVLFAELPRLHDLYSRLESTGSSITRLCGSGSAMIGIYSTISARDAATSLFPDARLVIPTSVLGVPAPDPEFY